MKKRKFLALLPMVALLLSGCQTQAVPSDAPSSEESESTSEGSSPSESTSEGSSPSENTSEGTSPSESTGGESTSSQGSGPGASTISYEVKIVSENTSLTQYDSMTLDVELYMYEYKEGEPTPTLISTTKSSEVSDGVSLSVDNESIIGIEGLVITALEAGNANITAHWNVDESIYDSDPVEFTVSEYIPTYTYEAKITSDLSEIEIGEHLVEVYLYTYADGEIVNPDGVKAGASDVTLTSGDSSIINTTEGSLTINALAAGETTLTATWIGHTEATDTITIKVVSSGDTGGTTPEPEPEPEPEDVYTYEVKIENKDAYTSVLAGYEHEEEDVPALQIGLYTYKNSEQESVVYPESTIEVEDLEISSSNSDLVDIKEDLTLDIKVDTELTDPVTISATWTGHYVDENESTVASDSVDVYISYTPYPVYIENISFTQNEYVLYYGGNEGESSTTVGVTYSPETVDDNSYSISVENSSVATFDPETSTLTAVGVGETTMTVSATYGGATGTATVKVIEGKTDLTSISLSESSYTLAYNEGYGSFTIGVGDDNDINVTLNPDNPDYKQLSVSNNDGYLEAEETNTNMFVISVTDSAKEVLKDDPITTELSIASTYYSDVEAQTLTVKIEQTPAEIAHPVEGILLDGTSVNKTDTGYQTSVQYNGTLTLGTTDKDINVSILPDNAYSTAWSAEVSTKDSSSTYISLTGDSENGYTITPINGEVLTEDTEATVIITSEGNGSDGNKLSVELTITIIHQDSYPNSLTITEYQSSVNLISNTTDTIIVNYLVKDQRDNEMEGLELSADVDNSANNTEVGITSTTDGQFVISAGSVEGSATISFYLTDYPDIKASETITVTVTDQYHAITAVSYTGGDQTLDIDLGGDTVYGSFTVTDDMVSFSNATGDVDPEDIAQGFTLSTDSNYVSIEENTITAVTGTVDGVEATITITSVAAPNVYTTFTVTVKDVTDYSVQSLTLVDSNGNDLESVTLTVSASEGSSNNTLESLGIYVSIKPDYATEKEYDVTISDSDYVTYTDGYISAAASKDDYSATLTVTSKDSSAASDSLTINVVTSYVKADVITVGEGIPTTMTEGDTIDLDDYVTISNSSSSELPTDQSYTVTSSNDAISVSEHTLTAESATDSDVVITITSADTSTTITFNGVEAKAVFESYTLTVTLYKSDNTIFPTATGDYGVYLVDESGSSGWITDGLMTNNGDGSYSYVFDTLPNVGTHEMHLFAGNEDGISWSHDLGYFTWTISGDETGNVVKDDISITLDSEYQEWYGDNGIFKPLGSDVEFYIVIFDGSDTNKSSSYNSAFTSATAINSELSCFNGNDWGNCSTAMTAYNQTYLYNTTPGEAAAGSEGWFNFSGGSGGVNAGTLTIPEVDSGHVAVYIAISTSENWNDWYNAWSPSWPSIGGWYTSYSSVSACINALATDVVWP